MRPRLQSAVKAKRCARRRHRPSPPPPPPRPLPRRPTMAAAFIIHARQLRPRPHSMRTRCRRQNITPSLWRHEKRCNANCVWRIDYDKFFLYFLGRQIVDNNCHRVRRSHVAKLCAFAAWSKRFFSKWRKKQELALILSAHSLRQTKYFARYHSKFLGLERRRSLQFKFRRSSAGECERQIGCARSTRCI